MRTGLLGLVLIRVVSCAGTAVSSLFSLDPFVAQFLVGACPIRETNKGDNHGIVSF